MRQFFLTPAAGKRLIAKAIAKHPSVLAAVKEGTVVVVAGTTNGYVATELLETIGQARDFNARRFFRGIVLPPARPATDSGMLADTAGFPGDVVISRGVWQKGKTIFDVVDSLEENDVILKGANAVSLEERRAAILMGDARAGTVGAALPAYYGRRVRLIVPVGLEKRIHGKIDELAAAVNEPGAQGPRLLPVPGEIVTEIDAIALLTGARASLIAAGGVAGAEGGIRLALCGDPSQENSAIELLQSIAKEPGFTV